MLESNTRDVCDMLTSGPAARRACGARSGTAARHRPLTPPPPPRGRGSAGWTPPTLPSSLSQKRLRRKRLVRRAMHPRETLKGHIQGACDALCTNEWSICDTHTNQMSTNALTTRDLTTCEVRTPKHSHKDHTHNTSTSEMSTREMNTWFRKASDIFSPDGGSRPLRPRKR